uniref:Uncharacterized protein n=1 Tax=Candidatus Kentrum sp. LFY TaxID=2126342 RepID=A0A450X0G3_9GAMM|nr:MAG: hypothetical protein BECKLFY1418B_GA0070995_100448 [Candidatus Kentron sp. LFY]VFJ87154.1 MAG: hypothetical protein BECKLFY1418A_GA0070994_100146 [Candidatus Kentron sp. LFY]VFK22776.1 MAG: hypothetical protein BECKLFY1418C_GA0070996_11273 [Candidatus Kentron sp. LFY]
MADTSGKTEVRVAIDSDFLKKLENRLGVSRSTDLARTALSLLDWASAESEEGRLILSTDSGGKNVHRLVMPELTNMLNVKIASE